MKLVELFLMSLTKLVIAIEGRKPTKAWMWLGIPFTIIGFCSLSLIMPAMYLLRHNCAAAFMLVMGFLIS